MKQRVSFFIFFHCLLLITYCLLGSCGKKGDPTLKSYEKPDPPYGLSATTRDSAIILQWEISIDEEHEIDGFHVMKSTNGDFEKIAFLENDKRSYIDKDVKIGFTYKYKIVSQNMKNVMSIDSNIVEITP